MKEELFYKEMASMQSERLFKLIKKEAFIKQKIILSSGKESDYYLDLRKITLKGEGIYLISHIFFSMIKDDVFSAIGGPTLGADPIISALSYLLFLEKKPINTFIIRKAPKQHGTQRLIEGPFLEKDSKVIIVDDVVTTGKSLIESVAILKQEGVKVEKALAVVDREEGTKEALESLGVELKSIFLGSQFLDS